MTRHPDVLIAHRMRLWSGLSLVIGRWLASVPPAIRVYTAVTDFFPTPHILRESSIPVDVARQRELKWLEMFSHWDKWLSRRFQKV